MTNALARRLVAAPHRSGGQAQFVTHHRAGEGRAGENTRDLSELLQWALQQLHEPLTVTDLARRAHVSNRHLARLFATTVGVSPLHWLLNQRIGRAQELLETTQGTIDDIAGRTGSARPPPSAVTSTGWSGFHPTPTGEPFASIVRARPPKRGANIRRVRPIRESNVALVHATRGSSAHVSKHGRKATASA